MYLKEIEIQGFKSFADKTKVTFDQGVTAVVGPNGSGKSNITESLRWALGESSAKSLRGGKMPDVIFAGTETRRPLNYAQVRVTLDNSDGFIKDAPQELSVERHIYRNGDSDYLIEGKKVRLRDIHDLFMDTGLGRDSFSIISQGRVEAIFNSKAEDRRAIFEEAAGVLKYKTRKKETEAKLAQTQDNLDRLEDIIYELEQQIRPLEKQAQTARQFLALDEERKELHLQVLVHDISTGKKELQVLADRLSEVRVNLETYYQERQKLETSNQSLKTKRHQLSQDSRRHQDDLVALTSLIADLEKQIQVSQLQQSQSQEKESDLKARLKEQETLISNLEVFIRDLEEKLTTVLSESQEKASAIKQREADLKDFAQSPDQIIESLREQFVDLMSQEADLSNQLTALENRLLQEKQQSEQAQAELLDLEDRRLSMTEMAKETLANFEAAKEAVKALLDDYQKQLEEVKKYEETYQKKQKALFDKYDSLKGKTARRNSLEAIQKNHSQFFAGVKAVLQNSERIGGIVGAVSEHLSFKPEHQTAMEIVLGGAAQNIIVEDERTAKKAIQFLKEGRHGRATFLPLTTIKERYLKPAFKDKLLQQAGFLGLAKDLVSYDSRLNNIMGNLLGMTAIFDTIDHANQAARDSQYQVRIVTLDGTELRPGGSFAGGANRQKNTTFVKPELDQLETEIAQMSSEIKADEETLASLKDVLDQSRRQLSELKQDGEEARLAEQKADFAYQQAASQVADLNKLYQAKLANQKGLTSSDDSQLKEDLQVQLERIRSQKDQLNQDIEAIKTDKDSIEAKRQELQDSLSELRLSERELQGERQYLSRDLDKQKEDLQQARELAENLAYSLSHHNDTLEADKIPEWQRQLEEAKERKTVLEQEQIRLRFELEDLEAQGEDIAEHLQKLSQQNETYIRRQAELETQEKQVKQSLQSLAQDLVDSYQLSFSEAQEQVASLEDINQARLTLKDLQKAIKALGPVNLDAIEQYDEVGQRLTFLSDQKADLDKAKDLLLETISEMNEEVTSRFKTTFEAIRNSFKETFTQMFGGGSADLLLTDGNLLSAGVEISVQPPGKKIQSLNLMSGGEKALSALALLFAIIRVKTIPFVILDEVEAALDEANVKRFGDYLNRFDKSSQFIVVTHRKGTMAAADSIYGVTMQESGVSQILSVKLKEAEQIKGVD
ncbi:chromosome segregation protein SMC [Streptococcus thoraltensis]|uniref:chromosome segregation protein SMC n=1 Tax=Streptococcus thoraltensis TaxID=55085 RepID=UPI00036A511F|nr:chromosome segregation protein SMC [Streptococcus thoraltensis]MDY4761676.1 chromosome segregation protein SMC [Streptococcus thoraltensis]